MFNKTTYLLTYLLKAGFCIFMIVLPRASICVYFLRFRCTRDCFFAFCGQ